MNSNAREQRARRQALKLELVLRKSRSRGFDAGTFQLVDSYTNAIVRGDENGGFGYGIEDIEGYLG